MDFSQWQQWRSFQERLKKLEGAAGAAQEFESLLSDRILLLHGKFTSFKRRTDERIADINHYLGTDFSNTPVQVPQAVEEDEETVIDRDEDRRTIILKRVDGQWRIGANYKEVEAHSGAGRDYLRTANDNVGGETIGWWKHHPSVADL